MMMMKWWLERVWTWGRHEYSKKQLPGLIGRPSPPHSDDDDHVHQNDDNYHENFNHSDDDDHHEKKKEISFELLAKCGRFLDGSHSFMSIYEITLCRPNRVAKTSRPCRPVSVNFS